MQTDRSHRIWLGLALVFSLINVGEGVAHTIDAVTVTPAVVVLEEGAAVTVTAEIADKDVFSRSVHVQQQGTDGQWRIAGLMEKTDKTRWTYTQTVSTTAVLRLRVGAIFRQPWEVVVSSAHLVRVGQVVEPEMETIVSGPEGVQLRVLPGALNVPAVLTVAPVPEEEIAAPLGSRPVVAAVDVVVEPVEELPGLIYLVDQPFELSLPLPAGLSATDQFYMAVQGLADVVEEGQEGIAPRLIVVDTGIVEDGRIVSQATDLAGIFSSGRYVIQQKIGSGFVEGVVRDEQGNPRGGVFVQVSSDIDSGTGEIFDNQEVFYTDADGRYKVVINGDTFEVTAVDVFDCIRGSVRSALPGPDSTATADISVDTSVRSSNSRSGVIRGGFEATQLDACLRATEDPRVSFVNSEGGGIRDLSGSVINPVEGSFMAVCCSLDNPISDFSFNFTDEFTAPVGIDAGSDSLYFHVNYWCGTCFEGPVVAGDPSLNDVLTVTLADSSGAGTVVHRVIRATDLLEGWTEFSIPTPVGTESREHTLSFSVSNTADNLRLSSFVLDNIRFNTIWLDVKIMEGSGADEARVRQNARDANEILAQTGLNIRIRNIQTIADPGGLLDTDVSLIPSGPQFLPTTEEQALLSLARSDTDTDINVYYVRSLEGLSADAWGIAIGPDDYVLDDAKAERGLILADLQQSLCPPGADPIADDCLSALNIRDLDRELLAHELGHLLIPLATARGSFEHGVEVDDPETGLPVADTTNIMQSTRCKAPDMITTTRPCYARTFFNAEQTEFIQRPSLDTDFIDPENP